MKNGFYTALGTPVDGFGNLMPQSFKKHITDQVDAGASGLLVMGSMGIQPCIKQSEYVRIAKASIEAAKGKCPVFVGVMDNSVARVMDRIMSLEGLKIDGVVATTPFYFTLKQDEIRSFFEKIAVNSPFPLYLYDLPSVTKLKIDLSILETLMPLSNIKGIKTGDITMARALLRSGWKRDDFEIAFSGLDVIDIAYNYGLTTGLDGMFCCAAPLASKMYDNLEKGSLEEAAENLDCILKLRETFIEAGLFQAFSHAMNLLGYEGSFAPDYALKLQDEKADIIKECMSKYGLL